MQEKFTITGMSCAACSAGIEKAVRNLSGVEKAEVSLMGEWLCVDYDATKINKNHIIQTVESLGYGIFDYDDNALKKAKPQPNILKSRFFLSLAFLLPLMYFSMGGMLGLKQPSFKISAILQAILSLGVIILNFKFFKSGAHALVRRLPNMDTLVAMGSGVSYLYSLVLTILMLGNKANEHTHLFYESAAMILCLVTLGKWLEEKSKRKTGLEIEKLINLMPSRVVIERDGVQKTIDFAQIQVGDVLVVKQGEYVPVDGKIIEGQGFIDRAAITGESMPLELTEGDSVTSADILKSGYMKVLAQKVGANTTLSQIVKMVKEAGASKAPIQKTADKIAGVFVPVVSFIAVLTFLLWYLIGGDFSKAINYSISVLVISCPCSLGLATPVAIMAATGRGMSLGILFKDAETLQKAKNVNCVLLDKTATLTHGKPIVQDFYVFDMQEEEALNLAFCIEKRLNHPIAECIQAFANSRGISEEKISFHFFEYQTGKGSIAALQKERFYLGNRKLLGKIAEKQTLEIEKTFAKQGKTAVFLANEKGLCAVFGVADALKEESAEVVATLQAENVRVAMVTGDNENVAQAIASQVKIRDYFASALPKEKAEAVQRVQAVGGFVAMVGDGINDAPALKAADIGVAMGNGTDVAMDSADVVLARGDLRLVPTMVALSRATVRNIKQNLFWAFFYNCLAIPVAAGAFAFAKITLNPMIAATAMSLSSLFVVSNALRLTRFQTKNKNKKIQEEKAMKKTMKIEDMMCVRCVAHVTKALQEIEGVTKVEVILKKKTATVELEKEIDNQIFIDAIMNAGYEVKSIS